MVDVKKIEIPVGDKTVTIETGKYAKSASGSVVVRCGDTMLLVHAVVSPEPRVGIDFFPLLIDYEERMSAIGRIPGGYNRSEGKASDKAILISRLIDRPIRPLFPKGYRNDVQIVSQLVSLDENCQPDTLAMLGSSAGIMLIRQRLLKALSALSEFPDLTVSSLRTRLMLRLKNPTWISLLQEQKIP